MSNLAFIPYLAKSLEEYRTLVNSINHHRLPAAVTGLAGIHKNHFTAALGRTLGRKILYIASDEAEAVRLCDDLTKMGRRAFSVRHAISSFVRWKAVLMNTSAAGLKPSAA